MNFIRNWIRKPKPVDLQASSGPKPALLPSSSFADRINAANEEWLDLFTKPSLTHSPYTRGKHLHLLGTNTINVPCIIQKPFSPEKDYMHPGQRALDLLMDRLQLDKGFSKKSVSVLVDNTEDHCMWLVEDYADIIHNASLSKLQEHVHYSRRTYPPLEEFLERQATQFVAKNPALEDIKVPMEWMRSLNDTGLIPDWDLVTFLESLAFYRMQFQEDETLRQVSAKIENIDLVGLERHDLSLLLERRLVVANGNPITAADFTSALTDLYAELRISSEDMRKIQTGQPMTDSAIQKLVLGPCEMQEYFELMSRCTSFSKPTNEVNVRCDRLLELVQKQTTDVVIVLTERHLVSNLLNAN